MRGTTYTVHLEPTPIIRDELDGNPSSQWARTSHSFASTRGAPLAPGSALYSHPPAEGDTEATQRISYASSVTTPPPLQHLPQGCTVQYMPQIAEMRAHEDELVEMVTPVPSVSHLHSANHTSLNNHSSISMGTSVGARVSLTPHARDPSYVSPVTTTDGTSVEEYPEWRNHTRFSTDREDEPGRAVTEVPSTGARRARQVLDESLPTDMPSPVAQCTLSLLSFTTQDPVMESVCVGGDLDLYSQRASGWRMASL